VQVVRNRHMLASITANSLMKELESTLLQDRDSEVLQFTERLFCVGFHRD
jgi:hypothetical protein